MVRGSRFLREGGGKEEGEASGQATCLGLALAWSWVLERYCHAYDAYV